MKSFSPHVVVLMIMLHHVATLGTSVTLYQTIKNTDYIVKYRGGFRALATDPSSPFTFTVTEIVGSVTQAYVYYHYIYGTTSAGFVLNGNAVSSTLVGAGPTNCWPGSGSYAYRADVTSIVANGGNTNYDFSGFPNGLNGVSLIVFYDDGISANDRDVVIFNGNDAYEGSPAPAWIWSYDNIHFPDDVSAYAKVQLHIADGQLTTDLDGTLYINSDSSLSPNPLSNENNGLYWDATDVLITTKLNKGSPSAISSYMIGFGDCIALVVVLLDLPAGASSGCVLESINDEGLQCLYDGDKTVQGRFVNGAAGPLSNTDLAIEVVSGPNTGLTFDQVTNSNGEFNFVLPVPELDGVDSISICCDDGCFGPFDFVWDNCTAVPVCDDAVASQGLLWPPNSKFVTIGIEGVTTTEEGDTVTIEITGVWSDEPTLTKRNNGTANSAPDAIIAGGSHSTVDIRSQRLGNGNGRVYTIEFLATNSHGATCTGDVRVVVPRAQKETPINGGKLYDATI